jgi:hypothetical protein
LLRILAKAHVKPWPKLFQNLRATRETELTDRFPIHVVCEWIGNSEVVARKHYLQVTDEHFDQATEKSGAESGAASSRPERPDSHELETDIDISREIHDIAGDASLESYPARTRT